MKLNCPLTCRLGLLAGQLDFHIIAGLSVPQMYFFIYAIVASIEQLREAQVTASDEFKAEVAQYESRIAEYGRFNGLLLQHLEEHLTLMERKIEEAQAAE